MKTPSNYANQQCHAEGEPREPVLILNEVKGKDGVVGVHLFGGVQLFVICLIEPLWPCLVDRVIPIRSQTYAESLVASFRRLIFGSKNERMYS